jgi:dGTPase
LTEAADDICYTIADLEDGAKAGKIKAEDAEELLRAITGPKLPDIDDIADGMDRLGYLRAKAIGALVEEAKQAFLDHEDKILAGGLDGSLMERVPRCAAIACIEAVCRDKLFNDPGKLESELGGFEVVRGLMHIFGEALIRDEAGGRDPNHLPPRYRRLIHILPLASTASRYERLLRLTDYVSGMTDRFAVTRFHRLTGHSLGYESS